MDNNKDESEEKQAIDDAYVLIDPLLAQIEKECDDLKAFIKTKDFPYHKLYYFDKVVKHASAMILLAGEIKALKTLEDHTVREGAEPLIERLSDCKID